MLQTQHRGGRRSLRSSDGHGVASPPRFRAIATRLFAPRHEPLHVASWQPERYRAIGDGEPYARARTAHPTGSSSTGGGSGASRMSLGGGAAATSSTRRPSDKSSGVAQRLHDIANPSSDHFQHAGQQTLIIPPHS